jgi:hypothetical protein
MGIDRRYAQIEMVSLIVSFAPGLGCEEAGLVAPGYHLIF